MKLSIIVVNYRSSKYITDCIHSALQFQPADTFEWIIVDNDSQDESEQVLSASFPFIKWIQMGYNAGFARANNEGICQASGDMVLLLNPDTIVQHDAIAKCLQQFNSGNEVACGVQLLYPDGSYQMSGHYFMKGGLNHLLPLPYWGGFLKGVANIFSVKKPGIEVAEPKQPVDWISGAFLMVKKSAVATAGMMDEDFFLYAEEVEWCSRLKRAGMLVIYGNIQMIHISGMTINSETKSTDETYNNLFDKKGLQYIVSNHVRIRKQYGVGWFLFQLLNYTWAVPVFFICSILKHLIQLQNPFKEFEKISGLAANVFSLWKITPVIISGKPYFYKMI